MPSRQAEKAPRAKGDEAGQNERHTGRQAEPEPAVDVALDDHIHQELALLGQASLFRGPV